MISRLISCLWACGLLLLLPSAFLHVARAQDVLDGRDLRAGWVIPRENYCDQPYVVITHDGQWLCTLTTGAGNESQAGQHVISTISTDHGRTWSKPVDIESAGGPAASWVVPLVTPAGRVYALYNYNGDRIARLPGSAKPIVGTELGWYVYKYSDDNGQSWSPQRYRLPMRTTAVDRSNPWHGQVQMFWGIDKPIFIDHGKSVLFAFTKLGKYMQDAGEGWFYRSDNLPGQTDPAKIDWQLLPDGDRGVRNPDLGSVQEEHNVVELDGGTLLCVYRTTRGFPCQSFSRDGGHTWSNPEPMSYGPGGRVFKQNRACPRIWKTAGGKYLFWFHHNSNKGYLERNPVWISGGIEHDGVIHWSEPEILLYDRDPKVRISYPDLIEQDGRFWVTETQKTIARVHEIDPALLEGLWNQSGAKQVATRGLVSTLDEKSLAPGLATLPALPPLGQGGGFSLDLRLTLTEISAGQIILDWRAAMGKGIQVRTGAGGTLQIELSDGKIHVVAESDAGSLQPGKTQQAAIIVDGAAKVVSFVIDGKLCDGGAKHILGFTRIPAGFDVSNSAPANLAPALHGRLLTIRLYDRYLRTSEAVANFRASATK